MKPDAPAPPAPADAAPAPAASADDTAPAAGGVKPPPAIELTDPPPVTDLFPNGEAQSDPPDISENVTINLLRALVAKGILSNAEATLMVQQAQAQAEQARSADKARKAAAQAEEDEAMRVSYVPEIVKKQMRDELRAQILADLRNGDAKNPLNPPPLDTGVDVFGDIRLRYELVSFPEGNDNTGAFPIFNSINTGAPFDTAGLVFSPQYNTTEERNRYRLRLRLGAEFELDEGWSAGVRFATGENNSPTTTNQSVGLANQGQGGNFSKYAIWLDRAYAKYYAESASGNSFTFLGGRFDSPFTSTDIIFDEDLGFDGLAVKLKGKAGSFKPFINAGAFPIFNTDLNFSTNQPVKFESTDKFLYAAQIGTDIKLGEKVNARIGAAYYNFKGVEGKLSSPYLPLSASDAGDTDNTRPSFAQKGNTYRPLRNIIPDPLNNFGTSNQYQYFGLATPFEPIAFNGRIDYNGFEPVQISVYGEWIKNTAFDREAIEAVAVNNRGPLPVDPATGTASGIGLFDGDDTAWVAGVKFGHPALQKRWDWNAFVNYRWVGSDAVVDGFNDSEFGGGGTNVKGYTVGANVAISKDAALGVSWLSGNQIAGPPLQSDYLQVDFKLKF